MLRILEKILSFVFPKNETVELLETMSEEKILESIPHPEEIDDNKLKCIFNYKNDLAKQAIWEIKYKANKKISDKFAKLLYEFIISEISDACLYSNFQKPIIVPVPSSKQAIKSRGFNQCEIIVKKIESLDEAKFFEFNFDGLKKIKETNNQSKTRNRTERLKNLEGAFEAKPEIFSGKNVIIIDDVITTGATMHEISKTLRKAGAKNILGFAIAH